MEVYASVKISGGRHMMLVIYSPALMLQQKMRYTIKVLTDQNFDGGSVSNYPPSFDFGTHHICDALGGLDRSALLSPDIKISDVVSRSLLFVNRLNLYGLVAS